MAPSAREVLRIKQEFQSVLHAQPGIPEAAGTLLPDRACASSHRSRPPSCCLLTRATRPSTSPRRGRGSCSQRSQQQVRAMDDPGSHEPGLCSESDKRYSREQRAPLGRAVLCTLPPVERAPFWVHHGCFGFGLINAEFLIFRVYIYQSNSAAGDLWGFN